jgi:L-amino acid N-acyltransferase YncA
VPTEVLIRPARKDDAGAIQVIYAPLVEHTAISFEETAPTVAGIAGRIVSTLKTHPYLVAEQDGLVVGYAHAGPHRTRAAYRYSVDVSAYVSETARGLGIGKILYCKLFEALAQGGFHAAFAGIALPNPASVALHRSAGFVPVGIYRQVGFKFGRWHDVGWWQRLVR